MRRVRGEVVLPADAPTVAAARAVVEVRDVSYVDAPSTVVADVVLRQVWLRPGERLPFALDVPEVSASHSLALRCHIDQSGDHTVSAGDLISTQSLPVPSVGEVDPLDVPVKVI